MGHVSFIPEGRLGNVMFMTACALGYSFDHGMEFSMPTETNRGKDSFWSPLYFAHLAKPDYDPILPSVRLEEKSFRFQELPFRDEWRGGNIVLDGYFQSEKYFAAHRERVLEAFGFPWVKMTGWVGVHIRRGDYLIHKDKHPAVPKVWYLEQIAKFSGAAFSFYSDDPDYVRDTFSDLNLGRFYMGMDFVNTMRLPLVDDRPEVRDMVNLSMCEHVIGSASTFAVWAGMLGRNPNRRVIIPKQWLVEGWQSTTAADWSDVVPVGKNWERA